MSTPPAPGDGWPDEAADAIEDAALAWIGEREDGLSPARTRDFSAWLAADPRHRSTLARLERSLALLGEAAEFRTELRAEFGGGDVVPSSSAASDSPQPHATQRRRSLAWIAAAAALAVSAIAWWTARPSPAEQRLVAAHTGPERIRLADGSQLELHAGSVARVRFSATHRAVTLETGEAYFAVAHDPARPFVVAAAGVSVRAVGTEFNVRAFPGAVEVIVVEGRVRVARGSAEDAETAPLVAAGHRATVPPAADTPQIAPIAPAAIRAALAWQNRLVEFAEEPLRDVIAQFNRRNHVQLVLADPALGDRRIGGIFALDQVEAFVRLLEQEGQIAVQHRDDDTILLRPARRK